MATKPAAYEPSPGSAAAAQPPTRRKDRTHWLYIIKVKPQAIKLRLLFCQNTRVSHYVNICSFGLLSC